MTPLPSCFSRLLRNTTDPGAQSYADTTERVALLNHLIRTHRCIALNAGHICGRPGGPICEGCRTTFGRVAAPEGR